MNANVNRLLKKLPVLGSGLLLLIALGCNSGSSRKAPEDSASPFASTEARSPSASREVPRPSLDYYVDRIRNAPAPFHLSWKLDDSSEHSDWEADVTANTIDGTRMSSSGTRPIHGVRSDSSSWQELRQARRSQQGSLLGPQREVHLDHPNLHGQRWPGHRDLPYPGQGQDR